MEAVEKKNTGALLIRRFIAIGLTALSILFLFFPAVLVMNREEKQIAKFKEAADLVSQQVNMDELQREKEDLAELFKEVLKTSEFKGLESSSEALRSFKLIFLAMRNLNISAFEARTIVVESLRLYEKAAKANPNDSEFRDVPIGIFPAVRIIVDVLFFGAIVLALASMVMMFFNRSRVFGVLYVILIFLLTGIMAIVPISFMTNSSSVSPILPGLSLFLLPIFSLAAVIVYKRNKVKKAKRTDAAQ